MNNKKHIVIVTTNFANGGTERRAMVLANGFVNRGYKVTYLVINKIYADVVYKLDERIELISLSDFASSDNVSEEKEISRLHIEKKINKLKILNKIAKRLRVDNSLIKRKINILPDCNILRAFIMYNSDATIISFGLDIFEKVFRASEGLNCKLIFSDASAPQFKKNPEENKLFKCVLSKILKKANVCIFQTEEQMKYYGRCVKYNGLIIKNPITVNMPPVYEGARKHTVVNFCRTHPVKNLILLVDAFKLFSEKFPDYSLEIYGSTSTETAEKYKAEVIKRIRDLGLEKKACVYDAIPNVHEKIFDYGMYVSSSDSEGLSNSMLEAMAMGIPCICTDCEGGGPKEVINDGENGLLVPVGDAEAMKDAMCRIVQENGLAEKLSRNATKIRTELSVENIVNKWIEIIESK
ncbi:MAG: glycosyltransferase [Clostridia bacterium]|nr:glycosyltransferase [Clostridia bacterium]